MMHMVHSAKLRNMASVYFTRNHEILLLYRQGKSIVSNMWIGSAGGHFEKEELNDAKACILREISEELGLNPHNILNLQLRYISLRKMDDEIRQNYYFFAELDDSIPVSLNSTEGNLQWFSFEDIADLTMPFTARYVVNHYIYTGRFNDHLYGGIGNETGMTFIQL